jgi:putative ABC transport system ATP-binding protein
MPQLTVTDLVVEYESGGLLVRPIDELSLRGAGGELVVLLGPSGCGKTTLLSCLGGILTPAEGSIRLDDTEIVGLKGAAMTRYRQQQVGIVFQAFNLIPSLTARENVAMPLLAAGVRRRKAMVRADALLEEVGLTDRAHHRPGQLSGGQQQRVAIARALAHDPPLVLADEPTANLDFIQAESVIRLLRDLRSSGRLIVVSTHDQRLVPIADQVVAMVTEHRDDTRPPQRVEYAPGESIFEQGTHGQLVYTIEEGEVDIVQVFADGHEERLTTLAAGRYFGELGPMLGFPRSASARARTDVVLTAWSARDFRMDVLGHDNHDSDAGAPVVVLDEATEQV